MSVLIVSDKTITNIISFIVTDATFGAQAARTEIKQKLGIDLENSKVLFQCEEFGKKLLQLNYLSYAERYNQKYSDDCASDYKFIYKCSPTDFVALRSIRCLLYQIEGAAGETELFKIINALSNQIATNIVNRIPEYNKLDWE